MKSHRTIVVVGMLAMFLMTGCKSPTEKLREIGDQAKQQRTLADLSTLTSCLKIYHLTTGSYPTEAQGLAALVERPSVGPVPGEWQHVLKAPMVDAWGREYRYFIRDKDGKPEHVVASGGPDAASTGDDIERVVGSVAAETPAES
jgi:general secretion pathway protein G